jgi:DNA adenine methylase
VKAPFPWFGGKSLVVHQVWTALGDVDNYVEPFAGSLAVLLGRPDAHERKCETVNDKDRFVANFWRAFAVDPDAVIQHADWPVNEADLTARHIWLVEQGLPRLQALDFDPDAFDSKIAGWWVWGVSAWIGTGWCSGDGPWTSEGVLGDRGKGVHRQLPHLGDRGKGVHRQLPHLGGRGKGVHRQLPHLGDRGTGVHHECFRSGFDDLIQRMRRVRVCCGDWSRVLTPAALASGSSVGVFLDPPYDEMQHTGGMYGRDVAASLSADVRAWAIANGDHPRMRIVLCGYASEHSAHMPPTWQEVPWKASKGYAGADNERRGQERVWLSPHCLRPQASLFG